MYLKTACVCNILKTASGQTLNSSFLNIYGYLSWISCLIIYIFVIHVFKDCMCMQYFKDCIRSDIELNIYGYLSWISCFIIYIIVIHVFKDCMCMQYFKDCIRSDIELNINGYLSWISCLIICSSVIIKIDCKTSTDWQPHNLMWSYAAVVFLFILLKTF